MVYLIIFHSTYHTTRHATDTTGGCLDIFSLAYHFSFRSPPFLGEDLIWTEILSEILSERAVKPPKITDQQTNQDEELLPITYKLTIKNYDCSHNIVQFSTQFHVRVCCDLYECLCVYFLSIVELTNYSFTKHRKAFYLSAFSFVVGLHNVGLLLLPISEQYYPVSNRVT